MSVEIRRIEKNDPILIPFTSDVTQASTEIWAGFYNGELGIVWGILPGSLLSDTAYIWSIATDVVKRCPKAFLRASRQWLKSMSGEYAIFVGLCRRDTTYVQHLGAEFFDDHDSFARFEIKVR